MESDARGPLDAKLLSRLGAAASAIDSNALELSPQDQLVALLGFQRVLFSLSPKLVSSPLDHLDDINTLDLPLLSVPYYVAALFEAYYPPDPSARLSNLRAARSLLQTFLNRLVDLQPVFLSTSDSRSAADSAASMQLKRQLREAVKALTAPKPSPTEIRESKIFLHKATIALYNDFIDAVQPTLGRDRSRPDGMAVPPALHPFALLMSKLAAEIDSAGEDDAVRKGRKAGGTVSTTAAADAAAAAAVAEGSDEDAGDATGGGGGGGGPLEEAGDAAAVAFEEGEDAVRAGVTILLRLQAAKAASMLRGFGMEIEMLEIRVDPKESARVLELFQKEKADAVAAAASRGPSFVRVSPGGVVTDAQGRPSTLPSTVSMAPGMGTEGGAGMGGGAVGDSSMDGLFDVVGAAARNSVAHSGFGGAAVADVLRAAGAGVISPELAAADAAAAAMAASQVPSIVHRPLFTTLDRTLSIKHGLLDNPNPPTETVDEYLERTNNNYAISQKDPSRYDDELREEAEHSSDDEIGERKRRRAAENDDWKDSHPTGMGRRHNRL